MWQNLCTTNVFGRFWRVTQKISNQLTAHSVKCLFARSVDSCSWAVWQFDLGSQQQAHNQNENISMRTDSNVGVVWWYLGARLEIPYVLPNIRMSVSSCRSVMNISEWELKGFWSNKLSLNFYWRIRITFSCRIQIDFLFLWIFAEFSEDSKVR